MFVNSERDIIRYEMDRYMFEACVNDGTGAKRPSHETWL